MGNKTKGKLISTKITAANIELVMGLLAENPRRLAGSMAGITDEGAGQPLEEGEWSLVQILAHLRGCQAVWSQTIYATLILEKPELATIHPRRWAKLLNYEAVPFSQSLGVFEGNRGDLIRVLATGRPEMWAREMVIDDRTHTVYSQARRMVLHEIEHIQMIEAYQG